MIIPYPACRSCPFTTCLSSGAPCRSTSPARPCGRSPADAWPTTPTRARARPFAGFPGSVDRPSARRIGENTRTCKVLAIFLKTRHACNHERDRPSRSASQRGLSRRVPVLQGHSLQALPILRRGGQQLRRPPHTHGTTLRNPWTMARGQWRAQPERTGEAPTAVIKVGDLVYFVRSCCMAYREGHSIFVVHHIVELPFRASCSKCGQQMPFGLYAGCDGKLGAPVGWLRRIPPLSELESTEHKEEQPA